MTKLIMVAVVWVFVAHCFGGVALAVTVPRVPWLQDPEWGSVLELAQDESRPILVDFHASWCGPCKMLDSFVYNEKDVIDELVSVITIKLDVDVPANGHLKKSFDITLLPTLIWCDSNGKEVGRFTGFLNRDEFLEKMQQFRQAELDYTIIKDELVDHPQKPDLLLRMAGLEVGRGNDSEAEIHYRRLINMRLSLALDEESSQLITEGILQLAALKMESGLDSEAQNMGRMAARLDGTEIAVAIFQESIGDAQGVLETYRQMIEKDDMDVAGLTGFARAALEQRVELVEGSRMAIRAAVLSDEDPQNVALLSELFYVRGLYRKSIRWIKKAVAVEPDSQDYRDKLVKYEAALKNDPYGMKGVPD